MNYVYLCGRIGAPPEYEVNAKGTAVLRFSLAVQRRRGKAVNWIQCIAYGKVAELIRSHYGTGDRLLVKDGELEVTRYQGGKPFWIVRVRLIEHLNDHNPSNEIPHEG